MLSSGNFQAVVLISPPVLDLIILDLNLGIPHHTKFAKLLHKIGINIQHSMNYV